MCLDTKVALLGSWARSLSQLPLIVIDIYYVDTAKRWNFTWQPT
jgi:hypothetical protein